MKFFDNSTTIGCRKYRRLREYAIQPYEKLNFSKTFCTRMKDFNNMPQNSILINFGVDYIIELINEGF